MTNEVHTLLGKLSWDAIPLDQPIPLITSGIVIVIIVGVLGWTLVRGHFPYVWR